MTNEEIVAVVTAHSEGKKIAIRYDPKAVWKIVDRPNWNFELFDYKIAEREIWVNEYHSGSIVYHTLEEAKNTGRTGLLSRVHYREVL